MLGRVVWAASDIDRAGPLQRGLFTRWLMAFEDVVTTGSRDDQVVEVQVVADQASLPLVYICIG